LGRCLPAAAICRRHLETFGCVDQSQLPLLAFAAALGL
jgi:hypothetical protein